MKKIISVLGLLLLPFMCFAQLRSQVCIIKQSYDDKIIEMVKTLEPKLSKLGVEDTQKYFDDFAENGGFGSGFVYVAPNGKNYIITNRHVIEDSKSVKLIFQNEDGETTLEYDNVPILAADAEIDVAILAIPNGEKPFKSGFKFYKDKVHDGDSVYTAGFPGLMGKPSWQFGAGIVTNASVKSEELIKPEISSVIQHSAQIDPGNSGGPLLVKAADGSYQVAGINTWKVSSRQDTNFAVPISTVEQFVNKVLDPKGYTPPSPEQAIVSRAESFQKIINRFDATFEEVSPFISMDFVIEQGQEIFDYVTKKCSYENKKVINEILVAGYPVEAYRFAIGWYIYNTYHENEVKRNDSQKTTVAEKDLPEIPTPVKYEGKDIWYTPLFQPSTKRYINIEWVNVNGGWQLYSCEGIKKDDIGTENKRELPSVKNGSSKKLPDTAVNADGNNPIYLPTTFALGYFIQFPDFTAPVNMDHSLDFEYKINNFLAVDCAITATETAIRIYNAGSLPKIFSGFGIYAGVQGQLPLWSFSSISMPYVTAQVGVKFNTMSADVKTILNLRFEAGYRYNLFVGSKDDSVYLDMLLVVKDSLFNFSTGKAITADPSLGFSIGAGYAF